MRALLGSGVCSVFLDKFLAPSVFSSFFLHTLTPMDFCSCSFHGRNGVSTVDYIICDELLFREIDFFLVKPLTTLSDHSQIITWLNIKSTLSFHKGNELDFSTLKKLPTQFIWDKDSANLFNQALISSRTQTLIADFINCEFPVTEKGIDEAVESFESILHSAASQSLKRKIVKRRRKNTNIITK